MSSTNTTPTPTPKPTSATPKATTKKKIVIAAIVILAITGILIAKDFFKGEFRYAGTLEVTRIDLPARLATVVQSIEVQEGQKVEKGQKLASLSCEDVRINARLADDNYRRAVQLKRSGSLAQEGFDQIASRKQETDTRISWCEVMSPVSGTVLNRFLEPGEWANPGAKIVSVADLNDIWAYIYVPQAVMTRLKLGAEVTGVIPELSGERFRGVIRKINEQAEFTPKNVQTEAERTRLVFGVKIAFENAKALLKPGMTIEVSLGE